MKTKLFTLLFAISLVWSGTVNAAQNALSGKFTINANGDQVVFSKGNLQYQASTDTWRFAEHQYDFVGDATYGNVYVGNVKSDNTQISDTYAGWIDLFGWGTGNNPTLISQDVSDYSSFIDWGTNNIENDTSHWRTFTQDEWYWLIVMRENRQGSATVNNVRGLILLPDKWQCPNGVTFTANARNWLVNNYTLEQWSLFENAGAVFFPAAGERYGMDVQDVQTRGFYYTATPNGKEYVYSVRFYHYATETSYSYYRYRGESVRLIQDCEREIDTIKLDPDSIIMATDLQMIYVNGDSLTGFEPDKYTYTYTYPAGTDEQSLPTSADITWTLGDEYQTVTVTQAGTTIIITVVSGRGLVTTYVLSFVIEHPNQFVVTTLSNNNEWGTVIGGNVYNANSNVSIGAFANDGYQFYHWNNAITDNPYAFTLTQDTSFVATFLPNTEEGIVEDVTSNSVHLEWEVKPWGNHGYWVWVYVDKDHKHWYCKMRFNEDGTLNKFYWGPASKHYDPSNPPAEMPICKSQQNLLNATTTISYELTDIDADTQYFYTLETLDESDKVAAVIAGTFTTEAAEGIDEIDSSSPQGGDRGRLILRDGQIYILQGDRIYTLQGQEIK